MGRRCCVEGCNSSTRLPEHHGVTYHSYPLDPIIRAIWIRNTRLSSERQITKSVLVCSRHFRRADFQTQRNGKYLLKHRVFPTVFPWGKIEQAQVDQDLEKIASASAVLGLNTSAISPAPQLTGHASAPLEDATKATVEAKVAQIMAETAELNASIGNGNKSDGDGGNKQDSGLGSPAAYKYESVSSFRIGMRLEVQVVGEDKWLTARVTDIDSNHKEVVVKYERHHKNPGPLDGTDERLPMISSRLRVRLPTRPVPIFAAEEKCMARWSGPRKFPGTVKKVLGNDFYEVLFDDGYVKTVRAIHMSKMPPKPDPNVNPRSDTPSQGTAAPSSLVSSASTNAPRTPLSTTGTSSNASTTNSTTASQKSAPIARKDWPLLDLSKLDISSLNLPEIPRDGEWACHWVNDQPIGKEGFLVVGDHRKPTVVVDDWRLPPGWVKHMYQRSNVLGKWDVILVSPGGKRFRSKSDLKAFLDEQGLVYNPDVYDFSIHRRRAKDINAYVYTPDYVPQPAHKPKAYEISGQQGGTIPAAPSPVPKTAVTAPATSTATAALNTSNSASAKVDVPAARGAPSTSAPQRTSSPAAVAELIKDDAPSAKEAVPQLEDGYAQIGGLKVQIVENLFLCPQESCTKNFRKENHLQMHIKHYHKELAKLLGSCPKMLELAKKRTHTITPDRNEPIPKNQIPNQQFFAKMHQQDLQHSRVHRKAAHAQESTEVKAQIDKPAEATEAPVEVNKEPLDIKPEPKSSSPIKSPKPSKVPPTADAAKAATPISSSVAPALPSVTFEDTDSGTKSSRLSPSKRPVGSRRSNRQRTTRSYLTPVTGLATMRPVVTADTSIGISDLEETRHSFNATPEVKKIKAPQTPLSSIDSPITADSGSSSLQQLQAAHEVEGSSSVPAPHQQPQQYIKEDGEVIKIVRMRQEEIINCLCGYGEEDGLMIQCELCLCWQHGACNGIDKEAEVPDKYVCFICRNPHRGRDSMKYKHDQDWLYDGKLPVANYHMPNPNLAQRFEFLKKSHTLVGNLLELKTFAYSLQYKINIANNRGHPKLYLWAKKWEEDHSQHSRSAGSSPTKRPLDSSVAVKEEDGSSPSKKLKTEAKSQMNVPNVPQPEAPIDSAECQQRLLEHIKVQQNLLMNRLATMEAEMEELEEHDDLPDLKDADEDVVNDALATFIKEMEIVKQIAKLNGMTNAAKQTKQHQVALA